MKIYFNTIKLTYIFEILWEYTSQDYRIYITRYRIYITRYWIYITWLSNIHHKIIEFRIYITRYRIYITRLYNIHHKIIQYTSQNIEYTSQDYTIYITRYWIYITRFSNIATFYTPYLTSLHSQSFHFHRYFIKTVNICQIRLIRYAHFEGKYYHLHQIYIFLKTQTIFNNVYF
jgi:hypothetical protein